MSVSSLLSSLYKLLLCGRSFFIICVSVILASFNSADAQTHKIEGYFDGGADQTFILCTQFGDFSRIVDTIIVDSEGFIEYSIPDNFSNGLYRIYLNQDVSFDLILNSEDINFSTSVVAPENLIVISKSEENKVFYEFKSKYSLIKRKLNILSQVIISYPDDPFLKKIEKQFDKEKKDLNNHIKTVRKGKEDLFASRLIHYYSELLIPAGISDKELIEYYNENYWNYFPIEDSELINSDAYTIAMVGFLKVQIPPNISFEKMQENYMAATDKIMLSIRGGDDVYQFVLKYLLDGFEQFEMWDVVSYLAETYGGRCTDADAGSTLSSRIKNYTDFVKGKKVPDIEIINYDGKTFNGFNSKFTLVVFWATWCGNCKMMIPELNERLEDLTKLEVEIVSISLDNNVNDLKKFLDKEKILTPVYCDEKGWATKPAVDYAVYATPSMYLVDENGILLGKPMYVSDVFELINEFNDGY
jgi:peroxiredoxin